MSTINNTTTQSRRRNDVSQSQPDPDHQYSQVIAGDDLPTYDTVIIRSDGSYQQEDDLAGVGFTIQTRWGKVIHEEWGYAHNATTSMQTEATAVLRAIQTAKLFSPSYVIVYADCKPVVSRVTANSASGCPVNRYVAINIELQDIDHTSINHISREDNRRADTLAHTGLEKLRQKRKSSICRRNVVEE